MKFLTSHPLLLLIDLQHAIDDPSWGERNNPDAEVRVAELLAAWRKRGTPILHVKHMSAEPTSTYRPGQRGNDFKDMSAPLAHEDVLEKQSNSAFIGTGLAPRWQRDGITEVVIVGVVTNNSVEATARMSGNLGFKTWVVADATFTFAKQDYAGVWRSAEDVHNMSLANLSGEYADIVRTAEVLTAITAH
ncbi:MAG: cysteine hydrolase family protein [Deinococcota bacterium]